MDSTHDPFVPCHLLQFVLLAAGPVLGPYLVWNVIQGSYKDGLAKKNN